MGILRDNGHDSYSDRHCRGKPAIDGTARLAKAMNRIAEGG